MSRDILIVEDDQAYGDFLAGMLLDYGHRAVLVRDEAETRQVLDTESPCLILIGLLEPSQVRAIIRYLRTRHRAIPTVIMSTSDKGTGAEKRRYGGSGRLPRVPIVGRPTDSQSLIEVVDRFCGPPAPVRAVVN